MQSNRSAGIIRWTKGRSNQTVKYRHKKKREGYLSDMRIKGFDQFT